MPKAHKHPKPHLLLHTCCAPCASASIERLKPDYNVTLYYYNPNIFPLEENAKRLGEVKRLAKIMEVQLIEADYEPKIWDNQVVGMEELSEKSGLRCGACFKVRLKKTAELGKQKKIDLFTTTLTISPHKNSSQIFTIGKEIASEMDIDFLAIDFKKKDGYKRSIELSKKYKLYRQTYCGCKYSI